MPKTICTSTNFTGAADSISLLLETPVWLGILTGNIAFGIYILYLVN